MKTVLDFLTQLSQNNNKEWFNNHRTQYEVARQEFEKFLEQLITGLTAIDPEIQNLTVKDCTYRIYRDTRFSPDKTPYKTHMGAYICREGKKSGYAGYYFHIEPAHPGAMLANIMCSGLYAAETKVLTSVRQEIMDHTELFMDNIRKADKFTMESNEKLKNVPRGFPADFDEVEYLKYKDYTLYQKLSDKQILSKDLLGYLLDQFSHTVDYVTQLNRAIEYAKQEM